MMRRTFIALITAFLIGAVSFNATAQDKAQHAGALRVGVSIPAATHGWPAGVGWWAEQTMKKYPDVQWEFQRAGSATEQAGHIEAMIEKGIDALVVLPFDSDTPLPAIKKAKRKNIYIVSVDRGLRQDVADVYIAGDNKAFGRKSAEYIADKLGGKGSIVILRGMPVEIDEERYQGAMEVFKRHPDIKVLGAQPGNWNRQDAHKVMQGFLTKFPRIDAVWASDDDMALGVEQAIKEAGRTREMWIFGGAGMKDIIKRVKDKDPLYPADITYPPGMIAAGIDLAVAAKRDGSLASATDRIPEHLGVTKQQLEDADKSKDKQKTIKLDVHLVTPDNADNYYFPESVY